MAELNDKKIEDLKNISNDLKQFLNKSEIEQDFILEKIKKSIQDDLDEL